VGFTWPDAPRGRKSKFVAGGSSFVASSLLPTAILAQATRDLPCMTLATLAFGSIIVCGHLGSVLLTNNMVCEVQSVGVFVDAAESNPSHFRCSSRRYAC
jgi:hypothetical protein